MGNTMDKFMDRYESIIKTGKLLGITLTSGQQVILSELLTLGDSLDNKRQCGLTTILSLMIVDRLINDKDKTNLFVSDSYQMNRTVLDSVARLLSKLDKHGKKYSYSVNRSKGSIVFTTRTHYSSIDFISSPEKLLNSLCTIDYVYVDNARYLKKEILLSLLQGLNKKSELYMASTG